MSALARLMRRHSGWIILAALLSFGTFASGLGLISLAAYLISRAAFVDSSADLAVAITGVRAFATSKVVLRYADRYLGHLATFRILTSIRVWFFRGLSRGSVSRYEAVPRGVLLDGITTDIDHLSNFLLRGAVPPVVAALTMALAATLLGQFSAWLALIIGIFVAICAVLLPILRRTLEHPVDRLAKLRGETQSETVGNLDGLADLLAAGRPDFLGEQLRRHSELEGALKMRVSWLRATSQSLVGLISFLAATVGLSIGVSLVNSGSLNPLLLAIIPLATIAAFEAVAPLPEALEQLAQSKAAAASLERLTGKTTPIAAPTSSQVLDLTRRVSVPTLELRDLDFSYSGGPPVLQGLNLSIEFGSHVALVGPNGCGKSSLVALVLGWYPPNGGEVRIGNRRLAELSAIDIDRLISVVLQPDHVFDTTAADNLNVGVSELGEGAMVEALAAVGLQQSAPAESDSPPTTSWLTRRTGADGSQLSGGERQRLLVARAVSRNTPVLILDEALAHLDEQTATSTAEGIRARRRGKTTVFITHQPELLGSLDQVIDLSDLTP